METVRFGVLGPLTVERDGQMVAVPSGHQRFLLALLLMHPDVSLSRDRLIDELWGDRPPASAVSALHVHLSKLRKLLGDLLEFCPAGYALRHGGLELDLWRFEALVEQARADPQRSALLLGRALELFRGEPLCDVACEGSVAQWRRVLEDKRWQAMLMRIDAELDAGVDGALVSELERLASEHPLDERLCGQLMLALYRAGRQADALDAYGRFRVKLAEELGLDPGPALQALHRQILEHAPALDADNRIGGVARSVDSPVGMASALPALATATIGREDALEDILSLLGRQEVRAVTLVGPGGVGKTRLALLAAHASATAFADGVFWVELAGVARTDEVASAIARALGVTPVGSETGEQALVRYLAGKQMMLVLDNFEHVIDSAGVVAELHRRCPDLTVLVTSREGLDLAAEHRYAVAPLRLPGPGEVMTVTDVEATPATAMFVAAARRRDHRFSLAASDVGAVVRICTRLEGLPMALELAAARTGAIDVQQLATDVETQLDKLGAGPRDAPARHKTLEATIEWSFRLLDPDLQSAFMRFSVFAGGATLDAAQTVTCAGLEAIEALVAKSLIDRRTPPGGGSRLMMLETVRHYALRQLANDAAETELRRRHLEYYLGVVGQATAQLSTRSERQALSVLDGEVENLQAARKWGLEHEPNLCLRLTGRLGIYWAIRKDPEALGWLDAALLTAGDGAPIADRARAHFARARLLSLRHRSDTAINAAEEALSLYRDLDDHAGIAASLSSLAFDTGSLTGDLAQERRYAESAVRHARTAGDDAVLATALSELAECVTGDERRPIVEQAVVVLSRVGDDRGLASLYSNAAYVALTEGQVEEATQLLDQALVVAGRIENPWRMARILGNLGLARLFADAPAAARMAFANQLRLCAQHALHDDVGEGLAGLAAIAAIEGRYEVAARLRGAVRTAGYPPGELDRQIDQRMVRDYLAPAQSRFDQAAWHQHEEAGAAWDREEATAYAIDWALANVVAADA